MTYDEFFHHAVGKPDAKPYPFQRRIAEADDWPVVLEIPTGLGKTEAIVFAWLYRRMLASSEVPRRLVYMLPQRTLVEQTVRRVETMLENLQTIGIANDVEVQMLMGGEVDAEWIAQPELPRILIGTQDMLLSRALNRGYAMSRFKWPMAFAWLHADALWVLDEVQLQGVGVTTAAQLQGLRTRLGTIGLTRTIFASATIERAWIDTVDHAVDSTVSTIALDDSDRAHPSVQKRLLAPKLASRLDVYEPKDLAAAIVSRHRFGTRTLAIVNTVDRAIQVYQALRKAAPDAAITLLHSRFRPNDRAAHLKEALEAVDPAGAGRIVVATQVVEAGVDFTSATLISDIAPWSSIVQRLGRCNRAGDDTEASFAWVEPVELTTASVRPYALEDVRVARDALLDLEGADLAPAFLPRVSMQQERGAVLREVDLLELFDTSPDLSGSDIDVSRFIRDANDFSVFVVWRARPPSEQDEVRRDEICPAPRGDVDKILKRLRESQQPENALVSRVASDDAWSARALPDRLKIGDIVWLASDVGGYDAEFGFRFDSRSRVDEIDREKTAPGSRESETLDRDARSFTGEAITIATHAADTVQAAHELLEPLLAAGLLDRSRAGMIETSARWHDVGKVHPVFQKSLANAVGEGPGPWAKSNGTSSRRHERRGFRHEVASALAWVEAHDGEPDADLIAYLIMAHHGKVRLVVQRLAVEEPKPGEILICGIGQDEPIDSVDLGFGTRSPAFSTDLSIFEIGSVSERPTWGDRTSALCADPTLGIFRLAYLESLVRVADWRASALRQTRVAATV